MVRVEVTRHAVERFTARVLSHGFGRFRDLEAIIEAAVLRPSVVALHAVLGGSDANYRLHTSCDLEGLTVDFVAVLRFGHGAVHVVTVMEAGE